MFKYICFLGLTLFTLSCGGDSSDNSTTEIADYIIQEGIVEMPDANGIVTIIEEPGDENKPSVTSNVLVDYRGYYLDGVEFDNSYDRGQPILINLQSVIKGWTLSIPKFGIGGKGKIIIPASLGYGGNPPEGIREHAVLVFEIELLDVDRILETELAQAAEKEAIDQYVSDNGLNVFETPEGVFIIFEDEGGSDKPSIESTVTIDYKGYFLNGQQFDSSYDRGVPSVFPLNQVIEGWQIAIPYFGKEGKGTLIIPSKLGYGVNGSNGIPPFSTLFFDIEVYDFTS